MKISRLRKIIREEIQKLNEREEIDINIEKISHFLGMRNKNLIKTFIDKYKLNAEKLGNYVQKGGIDARADLVTALIGKPNNKIQKRIIKQFK